MHSIAYFSDTVKIEEAKTASLWKDLLRPAGPWSYSAYRLDQRKGVLAIQVNPDTKSPYTITDVSKPVKVDEHLWYFPAKELPTQAEVAKSEILNETEDVILRSGRTLTIPLLRSAPRLLNSRTGTEGFADDFGKLGEEVFNLLIRLHEAQQEKEELDENFARVINEKALKLVYVGVSECYKVTDDLLDQLEWLSDADIMPIVDVILGLHVLKKTELDESK